MPEPRRRQENRRLRRTPVRHANDEGAAMSQAADDFSREAGRRYVEAGEGRPGYGYSDSPPHEVGSGWILFAGVMLGFAGVWNTLNGILAIGKSRAFVAEQSFVFSDLRTWGWIILFLGLLQLAAALMLASGSEYARWFGIGAAGLNAIGQLYFLPAQPWWSMAMFAGDVLIIYGLAMYAGRRLKEVE